MKIEEMKETMKKQFSFRSRPLWGSVGGILVFLIAFSIGTNAASVDLGNEKATYEELVERIGKKNDELLEKENSLDEINDEITSKAEELSDIEKQIEKNQNTIDEAMDIIENKESIQNEINDLKRKLSSSEVELSKLSAHIEAKESELAAVTGELREKVEAPKQLSAGQFIVGKDIPSGRYKAVPVGQGSNLFVYGLDGMSVVNTILGDHGVPEYVFFAEEGYIIETRAPAKFIPVE
jgi:septal ring factor EnvC (AmiA/AmiB activator)